MGKIGKKMVHWEWVGRGTAMGWGWIGRTIGLRKNNHSHINPVDTMPECYDVMLRDEVEERGGDRADIFSSSSFTL